MKFISIFVCVCCFCIFLFPVSADTLTGHIILDINKSASPLDPVLWPGNYFDSEAAAALLKDKAASSRIWKKIPVWQAGTWESVQATCTNSIGFDHNPPQHIGVYTCKQEGTAGLAKDKNGDIWTCFFPDHWSHYELDEANILSYVKSDDAGSLDYPDHYIETIDFKVDKSTNKIIDVGRRKSWARYIYVSPTMLKQESLAITFNEHGTPITSSWITQLMKQTEGFSSTADKELLDDLAAFLKKNDLANLIPIDEPTQISKTAVHTADIR